MQNWTTADIPNQTGTQAVVTGGSSGLGFETALALARAGADVIVADREGAAAHDALSTIRRAVPGVLARFERLDVSSLQSVADFAARLTSRNHPVDLLVHGAVVEETRQRRLTVDGFEMHLGVHFLAPFALTSRLLPLLKQSRKPRVVVTSSEEHRRGTIEFDDLQIRRDYEAHAAFAQSKLAALVFACELQRRSDALGWRVLSVAAHPGHAGTTMPVERTHAAVRVEWMHADDRALRISGGALSLLYAATWNPVVPGGYYGPSGGIEPAGPPGLAEMDARARDQETANRLWEMAEQLTGVRWGG